MSQKIMVVDDKIFSPGHDISSMPGELTAAGYEVVTLDNVETAYDRVWEENPDLILLDIHFQGAEINGIELCRSIRDDGGNMPIILISEPYDQIEHVLQGFKAGADDYIIRPGKDPREIKARILANLPPGIVDIDNYLRIDSNAHQVWKNDGQAWQEIHFRPLELKLLSLLVNNAGQTLPKSTIKDRVFEKDVKDDVLAVYIGRLRGLIEPDPDATSPKYIQTVTGLGYGFVGKVTRGSRPD